jgi:hypothetical protein
VLWNGAMGTEPGPALLLYTNAGVLRQPHIPREVMSDGDLAGFAAMQKDRRSTDQGQHLGCALNCSTEVALEEVALP